MKTKLPCILLGLSLLTFLGFVAGQEVELTTFLNGRANPNFMKFTKNVQTLLNKGTTGEVQEVKTFDSGNSGIKLKITSGPKNGQSYWVYYNKKSPAIALKDNTTKAAIAPEEAKISQTSATVTRDVAASRDLDEHAVVEVAREAARMDAEAILKATSIQGEIGCKQEAVIVTAPITPAAPMEAAFVAMVDSAVRSPDSLYSAQDALAELNSEELKFVGRDIMPGSGQNRSCIFQNSKVLVIYDNCMGNKKEAAVVDVKIVSKKGGEVSFYVENTNSLPVSKMKREQYDSTWRISYSASKPPEASTVAGVKKYLEANENNSNFCYIGSSFNAKDNAEGICSESVAGDRKKWITESETFWNTPTDSWYTTQAKLRRLIEKAPY